MKKISKKVFSLLLAVVMLLSVSVTAFADREEKPFLALGAEQTPNERAKVLSLLNIANDELDSYNVIYVTNQDEHDYLGSYMSKSIIGTRALSSVLVRSAEKGRGIKVTCTNINYCTPGMYRNALITAGVTDAEVEVVAPSSLPGTAALVGAMKSFEAMTGEDLPDENKDAATNELITTGEIAENIGDQNKAEELIGLIKSEVIDKEITDPDKISDVIDKAAQSMEVTLSDKDRELILSLMEKVSSLNLNIDSIKSQAKDLYDKLSSVKLDKNVWDSISQWFKDLWNSIVEFFNNLFNSSDADTDKTTAGETTAEDEESADTSDEALSEDTPEDGEENENETTAESDETTEGSKEAETTAEEQAD